MKSWVNNSRTPEPTHGHNHGPVGADLLVAIDPELTAYGAEYVNCPHIDIDPNIGLMLLMGLSNQLTVRKEALSCDYPIDDKINTQTPNTLLADAIEQAQREGITRMTVILRFPFAHKNGKRFSVAHGVYNTGNCIAVPVVIDTRSDSIEEWKADQLRTPMNGEKTCEPAADALARRYGFADARAMQNSQPLSLNNFWLNLNESRLKNRDKLLVERRSEQNKLEKKIAATNTGIEQLQQKINAPLPSEREMHEYAELAKLAREELSLLSARRNRQRQELLIARLRASEGRDSFTSNEHDAIQHEIRAKSREVRQTNKQFVKTQRLLDESQKMCPEYIERQRRDLQTAIEYKQEKIARLTTLLEECKTQIAELSEEIPKHLYAETDRNPNLLSLTVRAATPAAVIREIAEAGVEGKPIDGRIKSVRPMYKALYDRVLGDPPNGWLEDALDPKRPKNYYLRATRKYFEQMYHDAKTHGANYQNFLEFADDPQSSLSLAIANLREQLLSPEARSAQRKPVSQRA